MKRSQSARPLHFESLQQREMMAADAGFAMDIQGRNLVIEGTNLDDQVFVQQLDNNTYRVTGVNENGSVTQDFSGGQFNEIVFNGGEGDDHLYILGRPSKPANNEPIVNDPSNLGEDSPGNDLALETNAILVTSDTDPFDPIPDDSLRVFYIHGIASSTAEEAKPLTPEDIDRFINQWSSDSAKDTNTEPRLFGWSKTAYYSDDFVYWDEPLRPFWSYPTASASQFNPVAPQ